MKLQPCEREATKLMASGLDVTEICKKMNCGRKSVQGYCQRSTSSSADFHVRTFPLLTMMRKAWMESEAVFSLKSRGWLLKFDQHSFLWKTPQCSLFEDSTESAQSFPSWGTIVDSHLFQPPILEPITLERESTYWPTPIASDWKRWNQTRPTPGRKQKILPEWFYQKFGKKISVNTIEKMMGFPFRWAQLDHTGMQFFQWLRKAHLKN